MFAALPLIEFHTGFWQGFLRHHDLLIRQVAPPVTLLVVLYALMWWVQKRWPDPAGD